MRQTNLSIRWKLVVVAATFCLLGCAVGLSQRAGPPSVERVPGARAAVPMAAPAPAKAVQAVPGPRLPHARHLDLGLECADCHEAGDGGEPGYPDLEFCNDCHEEMEEDEEVPVEQRVGTVFFTPDEQPKWRKAIRDYDPDILFAHARHQGLECTVCHDDLGKKPRLAAERYTMDECMSCHRERGAPNTCSACHQNVSESVAPPDHRVDWERRHGQVVRSARASGEQPNCTYCHPSRQFCVDCHTTKQPSSHSASDWEHRHGQLVRDAQSSGQPGNCAFCHQDANYCNECHYTERPSSHFQGWELQHGRLVLQAGGMAEARCTFCHQDQSWCVDCHMNAKPTSHKHLWMRRHGMLVRTQGVGGQARCAFCHHEPAFCEDCHRDREPRDHTALFRQRTHGLVASTDRDRCRTCHLPDFCIRCHEYTSPRSHRGQWARGRNTHCAVCHVPMTGSCAVCHKGFPTHDTAPPMPSWHTPALDCRSCHNATGGGGAPPLGHIDPGIACQLCHQ